MKFQLAWFPEVPNDHSSRNYLSWRSQLLAGGAALSLER